MVQHRGHDDTWFARAAGAATAGKAGTRRYGRVVDELKRASGSARRSGARDVGAAWVPPCTNIRGWLGGKGGASRGGVGDQRGRLWARYVPCLSCRGQVKS